MAELQLRREKSFAEKLAQIDEMNNMKKKPQVENQDQKCLIFLKLAVIFFLVCCLRMGLDFGLSQFNEIVYGPQKQVCQKLQKENECSESNNELCKALETCVMVEQNHFLPKNRKEWIIQVSIMAVLAITVSLLHGVQVTVTKVE